MTQSIAIRIYQHHFLLYFLQFFLIFWGVISRKYEWWYQSPRAVESPVQYFVTCIFPYISSVLLTCVIMELVAASVVHFVNSSYPLPVDEILYFDKLCILFLLGMGLLEKVKVGTYQKHNSIDVRHIFL